MKRGGSLHFWKSVTIVNEHIEGAMMKFDISKTFAPVIVSASRSTDIPAFYSDWLVERLREGFCTWTNPFNRAQFRVSFEKTRMIVFWSKNPKPLLARLDEVEALGFHNYYFQFTLNDYEQEELEPKVPDIASRIETFRELSKRVGKARVIWRFDPLLLSPTLTVDTLLHRIQSIGEQLKGFTEKLVFSFADIATYRKVIANLRGTGCREFTADERTAFVRGLVGINAELGLELATCAEIVDLTPYGVRHNKCIDDDLMVRLFHDDKPLMDFFGAEYDLLDGWIIKKSKKDKGQRKACGCIMSKDIGEYNTCPHLCRYCYANATDDTVLANWKRHCECPHAETITGRCGA